MESSTINHVTELSRYALKHFSSREAVQLLLLEVKEQIQCSVLYPVHLKDIIETAHLFCVA